MIFDETNDNSIVYDSKKLQNFLMSSWKDLDFDRLRTSRGSPTTRPRDGRGDEARGRRGCTKLDRSSLPCYEV